MLKKYENGFTELTARKTQSIGGVNIGRVQHNFAEEAYSHNAEILFERVKRRKQLHGSLQMDRRVCYSQSIGQNCAECTNRFKVRLDLQSNQFSITYENISIPQSRTTAVHPPSDEMMGQLN